MSVSDVTDQVRRIAQTLLLGISMSRGRPSTRASRTRSAPSPRSGERGWMWTAWGATSSSGSTSGLDRRKRSMATTTTSRGSGSSAPGSAGASGIATSNLCRRTRPGRGRVSSPFTRPPTSFERLENPGRPGPWDRRGVVVGHVQSGKTAHYAGLMCKAADAGYKIIVVLAGLTIIPPGARPSRVSTEIFLGYDSQRRVARQADRSVGVGRLNHNLAPTRSQTAANKATLTARWPTSLR